MTDWPAAAGLSLADLQRYEALAYEWFCSCPKRQRRLAWARVMSYKTEHDRRKPRPPKVIPMPWLQPVADATRYATASPPRAEDR